MEQFFIYKAINVNNGFKINWDYINLFPEFNVLNSTEQNPYWHSEGNVMNHTKLVCDEMIKYINSFKQFELETHKAIILLTAALFHDIGKGSTTKIGSDGNWTSPNHAIVGEKITRKILWNIEFNMRESICNLVRYHMTPLYLNFDNINDDSNYRKIITLSENKYISIHDLYVLKMCDCTGSRPQHPDNYLDKLNIFIELAKQLNCLFNEYNFIGCFEKFNFNISNDPYPSYHNYDDTKFKVIMMCGLPGAGKDYYIKEFYPDYEIICRDDIRKEIGLKGEKPQGNKKEEEKVTRIVNDRIKECCRNNKNFVINATNLKKFYRDKLINTILPYKPFIEIVYVEAPTITDNLNRRSGQIPNNIIINMMENFDFPKETECHKLTIVKHY